MVVMNPRCCSGTLYRSLIYLNSIKKEASNKIYKIAQLSLGTCPDCPSTASSLSSVQHSQTLSASWWIVKVHRTICPLSLSFPPSISSFTSLLPFLLIKHIYFLPPMWLYVRRWSYCSISLIVKWVLQMLLRFININF